MIKSVKVGLAGGVLAVLVFAMVQSGVLSLGWPDAWSIETLARNSLTEEHALQSKEPATVVSIQAVSLDCRARIQARIPVEGRREHRFAGQVYRTDTVEVDALGDVDTCVDADAVTISPNADGSFVVDIPGDAIRFERPRIDMLSSAERVQYDKGFVGEVTDLVPGVDDTDSLVPAAFAYAQQVVGGSTCMQSAFQITAQVLRQAYIDQLAAQGVGPHMIEVIIGEPDFDQNAPLDQTDGLSFDVRDGGVRCVVAPDAREGESPRWEELTDQT